MKNRPEEQISLKIAEQNINNNKSILVLFLRSTFSWITFSFHGLSTALWTLISRETPFSFPDPIAACFPFTPLKTTHFFPGEPNCRHGIPRAAVITPGIYAFLPGNQA